MDPCDLCCELQWDKEWVNEIVNEVFSVCSYVWQKEKEKKSFKLRECMYVWCALCVDCVGVGVGGCVVAWVINEKQCE